VGAVVNEYYWNLAQRSGKLANINPRFIYCQWVHETGNFTSELCTKYHNLGGLTQTEPNDLPQPDGSLWYMEFANAEMYAEYFGRYLRYYEENGIYNATTIMQYAQALKNGGYFGDSVENYVSGMESAYAEAWG
jgi:hypothetical protein